MLSLILVLLLLWFGLCVFLAAWTLWIQPYLYTESVGGLVWRAPVAGTIVFLSVVVWVYLAYQSPDRYATLWQFSPEEFREYPELIVPGPQGKQDVYKRVRRDRRYVYLRGDRPLPSRPEKVIGKTANGDLEVFEPDRDANGKFKVGEDQTLHYRNSAGDVMEEGQLGMVRTFYPGRLAANLFLNFFHFAAWFLCVWLLLRYQWSHALGMAVVLWLVMILFILPQVLDRAEVVARQREAPPARAHWQRGPENTLDVAIAKG